MTEVALGVHTENPNGAYALYAGLGYEVVLTWTTYRKPLSGSGAPRARQARARERAGAGEPPGRAAT